LKKEMGILMKALLLLVLLCICTRADATDSEFHLGRFSSGDLTGWKEQTIGLLKPKTTYNLIKDNDKSVLVAHSIKSASGRIYTLNLDPKEYSTLTWSWKIDHTIRKGDEKIKAGVISRLASVYSSRAGFSQTNGLSAMSGPTSFPRVSTLPVRSRRISSPLLSIRGMNWPDRGHFTNAISMMTTGNFSGRNRPGSERWH
jgi:hypothetical protein